MQLDEDTLARRRRDLGEDHSDTLAAASDLAVSLRAAGEYQAARELGEDTLARRRRVLGEDHPDTLASADGLAISLRAVGGLPGTHTSTGTDPATPESRSLSSPPLTASVPTAMTTFGSGMPS